MTQHHTVNKAIFPVAGLGTRFLPATKAHPKEMLPIVDKPLIQYAVEEAIEAGITQLIFVTNGSKRAIEDHFDYNQELETKLAQKGQAQLLSLVQNILPQGVSCVYVRQREPLGLGHAVLCAQPLVGNAPFAVLLADDLIDSQGCQLGCLKEMTQLYHQTNSSIVAVEKVAPSEVSKYGIVEPVSHKNTANYYQVSGIVEKPPVGQAPSDLAVIGRYIFTPQIFSFLKDLPSGAGNEIQLTDAIAKLLSYESVYCYPFVGKRYDCGNKLGYLQANVLYALKRADLKDEFLGYLKTLISKAQL